MFYKIMCKGFEMGHFFAESAAHALDLFAQDIGYVSIVEMESVLGVESVLVAVEDTEL